MRVGVSMPVPSQMEWRLRGDMLLATVQTSSLNNLVVYYELRWRGYRVWPVMPYWKADSSEPVLHCCLSDQDLFDEAERREPLIQRINHERDHGDAEVWRSLIARHNGLIEDVKSELEVAGWSHVPREGRFMYIHVDDLEKIEGPPPEGAF